MYKKIIGFLLVVSFFLSLPGIGIAQQGKKGAGLTISEPWARATSKGQKTSAVYLKLYNHGQKTDYLLGAATDVADKVEIHEVKMEDGMMAMRPVKQIKVAAGQLVELKPGGYHIMLIGLPKKLDDGNRVSVTLTFKNAGKKQFFAPIRKMMKMKMPMKHKK
jgi:copper(I)-binding protein